MPTAKSTSGCSISTAVAINAFVSAGGGLDSVGVLMDCTEHAGQQPDQKEDDSGDG